jgi:hypothetical protein
MNQFLGPLDSAGRVPPLQQTRIASFLISAHGALARQLAMALPGQLKAGWQTELNAQLYRETEIVSLLMRATAWVPDFTLPYQALTWEAAWLPKPVAGVADQLLAMTIDVAALGHAVHGAIRPAALLPVEASAQDPFVVALRRIEFESSRLIQAQIHFLKGEDLKLVRDAVSAAVEVRHRQIRQLWTELLEGIGIRREAETERAEP